MKKLFAILLALIVPFSNANAGYGSAIFSDNKDIDNVIRVVDGIQIFYENRSSFKHLEHVPLKKFWTATYDNPTKEDVKNFEFTTERNNQIAVIKYKVKDCNDFKDIKDELITYAKIEPSTYVNCFANESTIWLTKEGVGISDDDDNPEITMTEDDQKDTE